MLFLPRQSFATSLILAWDYVNGSDPAVAFAIYRLTNCSNTAVRFVVPVSTQTFTDPGPFVARIRYCYTVVAVNSVGTESAPSNTIAVLCKKAPRKQVVCSQV